jgi:hypothetical protein
MKAKRIAILLIVSFLAGSFLLSLPGLFGSPRVLAEAFYYTPTPGPDGKIIYIVRENDSCLSISLKNGVSGDQIAQLNQLKPSECEPGATLEPGRQLILAVVEVLPTPTFTSTPSGPTPTPFNGNGKACFILFEDLNGNGLQDAGEGFITGGTVGVVLPVNSGQPYSYFTLPESGQPASAITGASNQPVCIDGLPEGGYILTATLPQSFQASTNLIYPAEIQAGQTLLVRFGAVPPGSPPPTNGDGSNRSPVLPLALGGILVLVGAALGAYLVYLRRANRKPPKNAQP